MTEEIPGEWVVFELECLELDAFAFLYIGAISSGDIISDKKRTKLT